VEFHHRFSIEVDLSEARRRFVNRAYNAILDRELLMTTGITEDEVDEVIRFVADKLGERFDVPEFDDYVGQDFHRCLQAIEVVYQCLDKRKSKENVVATIQYMLTNAEFDLGIKWEGRMFVPAGAKELDDQLVNRPLEWLRAKHLDSVLLPFEKGLRHLLQTMREPELRWNVITDMYESVEALAKAITARKGRDLSSNRELFLKAVNASEGYKKILKAYIEYANEFRHAAETNQRKPLPSAEETESFVYLTGLFVRMASRCPTPNRISKEKRK
jgi:hypothetical protein